MAHGLVQQDAGPARAKNHVHHASRRRDRAQVDQGDAQRLVHGGLPVGRIHQPGQGHAPTAAMTAGFAAVVVFHDHADVQPRHRTDIGDKPAFGPQDRHLLQGRPQGNRHLDHARIAGPCVIVDLAQQGDPGGEGDPVGRVGGHVQRLDLHGRGGGQDAAALSHGQARGFGRAAQRGFRNLGRMGIARHLAPDSAQAEALFGGIA